MKRNGFTLLEMFVVMAILGALISIALPRYARLFLKSKEAAMKGNLATIRSAVTVYYSANEGFFPASAAQLADTLTQGGKYLRIIPASVTYPLGTHADTSAVTGAVADNGRWFYAPGPHGHVAVSCTHPDTMGRRLSAW